MENKNKVKEKQEEPGKEPMAGDFYTVGSEWGTWYVSPETAARIGRLLDRRWDGRGG